jgi:hypothetical protein
VFSSGFAEETPDRMTFSIGSQALSDSEGSNFASVSLTRYFEDSDDEDDEFDWDEVHTVDDNVAPTRPETLLSSHTLVETMGDADELSNADEDDRARDVKVKSSHSSSPRQSTVGLENNKSNWPTNSGPPKQTVVVKDVAYSTYRAVLYYVEYHRLQQPSSD